jgi:hypothetical protein
MIVKKVAAGFLRKLTSAYFAELSVLAIIVLLRRR